MKNLTTLLQKADLTPKQRYLMLIQNDVNKEITGKEVLTEADKHALENWQATKNGEAAEWNRYNEGWRYSGRMSIEAEFTFLEAQVEHHKKQSFLLNLRFYPFYRDMRKYIRNIKHMRKVTVPEAVEIAEKQRAVKLEGGLDVDYTVYKMAFESLSTDDKEKFNELYPDIETDQQYLDQEEIIADLFDGKNELTAKAKETLATLVAKQSYNSYSKQYQIWHYFACIPITEVARHFLISNGITVKGKPMTKNQEADDEDSRTSDDVQKAMEAYGTSNGTTLETMLKEACRTWLDGDLLQQYTPLIVSNERELFDRWLAAKAEARKQLKKFIAKGELKIKESPEKGTRHDETITGESLYAFKGDYEFAKDFKKHVDEYMPNLGILYADDDPEEKGDHLDRELLICGLNDKGEASMLSVFGISIDMLEMLFEVGVFFEEKEKDGEMFLEFKEEKFEKTFMDEKLVLAENYSKLLAFQEVFTKLSGIYEIDITYRLKKLLEFVARYIDQHNKALSDAAGIISHGENYNDETDKVEWSLLGHRDVLSIKEDLRINKDAIVPNAEVLAEHTEKLRDIFGGDFQ